MTTILGLDADQNLSGYAAAIKTAFAALGCDRPFTCRYLKNLSSAEVSALHAAGISIVAIFEAGAENALGGADQGEADGIRALRQASALGLPGDRPIYATVDTDAGSATLDTIADYFTAFAAAIAPHPVGAYGSGAVLTALRDINIRLLWLAGAMGWSGSREFDAAGDPTMVQGPTLDHGGRWSAIDWPDLGFEYDPDIAYAEDFGAWSPATT